jgi:NADH-quinone oxidoreductase subunit M
MGLGKFLPAFMFFWGLFGLASFGFPGTNGFVGEFMIMAAAFEKSLKVGLLIVPGALLAAAYILKVTLKMAWGQPASPQGRGWLDLKKKEWAYILGPAALVIWLGLSPGYVLSLISPSVAATVEGFGASRVGQVAILSTQSPGGKILGRITEEDLLPAADSQKEAAEAAQKPLAEDPKAKGDYEGGNDNG